MARRAARIQQAAEWLIDQIPAGSSPDKDMFRDQATGMITTVKLVADVLSGLMGALDDPGMIVRGILRLGTGSAEGVSEWEHGDKVSGASKVVVEALTAFLLVLGGVGAARAAAMPKNPNLAGGLQQAANRAYYSQFERAAAEAAEGPLSSSARQVTIQPLVEAPPGEIGPQVLPARFKVVGGVKQVVTTGGKPLLFRIDEVTQSLISDLLKWNEAKSTATAPLTQGQAAGFPLLEDVGGIVRAHNAGAVGLPYGTVLGPQGAVNIFRPLDLLMRLLRPTAGAVTTTAAADAERDARRP